MPWVEEIREARAAAAEAQRAFQDSARVDAAIREVDVVATRADARVQDVPGAGELAAAATNWPALAHLTEPDPPKVRLAERKARLTAASTFLRGLADTLVPAAAHLDGLLQKQRAALDDPALRRTADAIRKRRTTLAELDLALLPAQREHAALGVVVQVLGTWLPRLGDDERGALVLQSLSAGLRTVMDEVPGVAADLDGATDRAAWEVVASRAADRQGDLTATIAALHEQRREVVAWLAERLG